MSDLTPRQTEILRLIQRQINETGMPPTRAEIANELGFKSPNAAEEHLRALARKGVIDAGVKIATAQIAAKNRPKPSTAARRPGGQ